MMINLQGDPQRNDMIRLELERARIPIVENDDGTIGGNLNNLIFNRLWIYWEVKGLIPRNIVDELYADPVGRTDIRIGGHCGCPSPDEYGLWGLDKNNDLIKKDSKDAVNFVVLSYHIDSEVGLRLFADTINKYKQGIIALNELI